MSTGRAVHRVREKMDALQRMLYRHGKIEKATRERLAIKAGINLPALKSAIQNQSFTPEMEEKLRNISGLNPAAPAWIDERINPEKRKDDYDPKYPGRDSLEAFHIYLETLFTKAAEGREDEFDAPRSVDKNLICHEVAIDRPEGVSELGLCLQADFGWRYQAGVKYVMRRVRLDVSIGCKQGYASVRLGRDAPYRGGTVGVTGRGTDRQPFWDIVPTNDAADILAGSLEIRTPPLASLKNFRPGGTISTRMLINVLDGDIVRDPDQPELTGAQATLIERAFTLDFGSENQEDGWLTLSRHEVTIAGGD